MKRILALMLALVMACAFSACGKTSETENSISFTLSINCSNISENMDAIENDAITDYIPEDGVVFDEAGMAGNEGSTIMDATVALCKVMNISYDKSNGYINMLANISNGDCGEMSGWLVKVNGEFPDVTADKIEVNEGDTVEWVYSLDGGADVGATM